MKEAWKIVQASFNFLWVFLPQKLPILKEISIWKFDVSSRQDPDYTLKEVCCSPRVSVSLFLSKMKVFMEVLPKID